MLDSVDGSKIERHTGRMTLPSRTSSPSRRRRELVVLL